MATNGTSDQVQQAFAPVLSALQTMQSNVARDQKRTAHEFLESFQKSPNAWQVTMAMLQSADAPVEAKLFAATTLKGKIIYDIHQIPRESLTPFRDSLLSLMSTYSPGPKPIRTQICVCLSNLAIHMSDWTNVVQTVISSLGTSPQAVASILEFLHVLPEEVMEGRKSNISEEQLSIRTTELLQENTSLVMQMLLQYSQSSAEAAKNPQLMECITSWSREVPVEDIAKSPLLPIIFDALLVEDSFDSAVECLGAIFQETRDVDENLATIQILLPRVVALRSQLPAAAEDEDDAHFKGLARVFAEAGEAWAVLIARMPQQFRPLVEAILDFAILDKKRDAVRMTLNFWFDLKQMITMERWMEARMQFADIYGKLVDVIIVQLRFPIPEEGGDSVEDLFEGDRDAEEKFRDLRHSIGDVLKDCCEVIGVTECLGKSYQIMENWYMSYGAQSTNDQIVEWRILESALFSIRSMGRMVSPEENTMLPRLIPLILRIPDHDKIRFQAVMVIGRYTEWTSQHDDFLQPQLKYIMAAFRHRSEDVIQAAATAFHFMCNDCAFLMKDFVEGMQGFYNTHLERVNNYNTREEMTEGVAAVIAKQPNDKIYATLKLYCDPLLDKLKNLAATLPDNLETAQLLADQIQLITIFFNTVQPYIESGRSNPAVQYCQEVFPILAKTAELFNKQLPILETTCRCWRTMVLSYRSAMLPLLPQLADHIVSGLMQTKQGCYLWAGDSIVREFSHGAEHVDAQTTSAIFGFVQQLTTNALRILSETSFEDIPDVVEDFFRLNIDVISYFPQQLLSSGLADPVLDAALAALSLLKEDPIIATLHFLRDFLAYGAEKSPNSRSFGQESEITNPLELQQAVKALLTLKGQELTRRLITGMIWTFSKDCFPDASGVLLAMFQLEPMATAQWVHETVSLLPVGSVTVDESDRLFTNIRTRIQENDIRRLRILLQDFTNSYRRRNVAPREGLGRLEATRFRFVEGSR